MTKFFRNALFIISCSFLASSCVTLEAPLDAHFGHVAVGVVSPSSDEVRRERLKAFEGKLRVQFTGSLQDSWIRCEHCEKQDPLEAGLAYVYILEHGENLKKFDKALEDTNSEEPKMRMVINIAPPPPTDCLSMACRSGCTCVTYAACLSSCRIKGASTVTCCTRP